MHDDPTKTADAGACRLDRTVRPDAWIRHNGEPYTSGVAHFGEKCPPGWVGAARAYVLADTATELRKWKSTNAPRLEALQGLLVAAQHEAHAGREAVTSLASERAANAILTDEVDRLRAALVVLVAAIEMFDSLAVAEALAHAEKVLGPNAAGEATATARGNL